MPTATTAAEPNSTLAPTPARSIDPAWCASSYLSFRHVVGGASWSANTTPRRVTTARPRVPVATAEDLIATLAGSARLDPSSALVLDGSVESTILAALVPRGTVAYSFQAIAGSEAPSDGLDTLAERCGLRHEVVSLDWDGYRAALHSLMWHKASPLHPVEPVLHTIAKRAAEAGLHTLLVGLGRSRHGAATLDPIRILVDGRSPGPTPGQGQDIDPARIQRAIETRAVVQAYENAIHCAGLVARAPFRSITLEGDGDTILREALADLAPGHDVPAGDALSSALDFWLRDFAPPRRTEFRSDLDLRHASGDHRFLVYCLDEFLELLAALSPSAERPS